MKYKTKYFALEELAHPQIIKAIGSENTWLRLDSGVLMDLDTIRTEWFLLYGSGIYINRLDIGLDSRGLRPPNDPDGSFYSVHKKGCAFDLEPVNGKYEALFLFIKDLIIAGKLKSINTLEDFKYTKTWVHIAKMNTAEKPLIVRP
jgi:hypothetical protein